MKCPVINIINRYSNIPHRNPLAALFNFLLQEIIEKQNEKIKSLEDQLQEQKELLEKQQIQINEILEKINK